MATPKHGLSATYNSKTSWIWETDNIFQLPPEVRTENTNSFPQSIVDKNLMGSIQLNSF